MQTEFIKNRKISRIKWLITGYDNYAIAENKCLYNRNTGVELPKVLKGYTIGYNLNSKFVSLSKLRPLLKLA